MRIRLVWMFLFPYFLLFPAVKAFAWQQAENGHASVPNQSATVSRSFDPKAADSRAAGRAGTAGQTFLRSPVEFQPNQGQFAAGAQFVANAANYSVVLNGGSFSILPAAHPRNPTRNPDAPNHAPLTVQFLDANPAARSEPVAAAGAYANYLVGNDPSKWLSRIPLAERVRTRELYPGVDLDFYGNQSQLEYDLTLAPGADARLIQISGDSLASVEEDHKGDLVLSRGDQKFVMHAPVAYQTAADGARQPVKAAYQLVTDASSHKLIRFDLGEYDHSRQLVIDPTVTIVYATYLGGSNYDHPLGVAVDASGAIYVTGMTYSTDYPTVNPIKTSGSIYLSKLNAAGTGLVYSTYLGGSSGLDSPGGMTNGSPPSGRPLAVDSTNSVYLVGTTQSPDFPVTSTAFQQPSTSTSAPESGFLLRLSADGTTLLYCTAFGSNVSPVAVAVDNNGRAYMTGSGAASSVPETAGAYYTPTASSKDYNATLALLAEFDTTMSGVASLPYSTVFGHIQTGGVDLALDAAGNIDLLGVTGSVFGFGNGTIDIAGNAYESGPFSIITPWIAQFSLLQHVPSTLNASTYLGGAGAPGEQSAVNTPTSMGVDGSSHVYVTGTTTSTTFPTFRAIQGNLESSTNGFLTEMTTSLQYLVYSTYIGDSSGFAPSSIAVASNGDAILTGYGSSGLLSMNAIPTVAPPMGTSSDGILLEVASDGQSERYATYLGTGGSGPAFLSIDSSENVSLYAAGGAITPTSGAVQSTDNSSNGNSPFLLKLVFGNTVTTAIDRIVPRSGANTGVTTVNVYGTGFQTGETLTLNCGGKSFAGSIFYLANSALSAYLDLRGAGTGTCDVVVANGSANTATAAGAFTVDGVASPQVFAQVVGPALIREGTGQVYTIAYGNTGNTDVYSVPLNITFPDFLGYTLITPLQAPPQIAGKMTVDYSNWPADVNDGNGNTIIALVIPIIVRGPITSSRFVSPLPTRHS